MRPEFLDSLRREAEVKEREEADYRRESRQRLERLEAARTTLYRRYNFLKDMAAAAAPADAKAAIDAQLALAAAETGWSDARTGYDEFRERLAPIAAAIHGCLHPPAAETGSAPVSIDIPKAFADFEHWHREKFGQEFLDLLGRAAPTFQPLVDF
jgi:hypothetical protein